MHVRGAGSCPEAAGLILLDAICAGQTRRTPNLMPTAAMEREGLALALEARDRSSARLRREWGIVVLLALCRFRAGRILCMTLRHLANVSRCGTCAPSRLSGVGVALAFRPSIRRGAGSRCQFLVGQGNSSSRAVGVPVGEGGADTADGILGQAATR